MKVLNKAQLAVSQPGHGLELVSRAPDQAAHCYGGGAYSRGEAKGLNRRGSLRAKITALSAVFLLVSAAAYLGLAAYREIGKSRRLNDERHFGFFQQNRLSNYATPAGRCLALLRHAGWQIYGEEVIP